MKTETKPAHPSREVRIYSASDAATDGASDRATDGASGVARGSWSPKNPTVVRALRFIAKKGSVTAEQLVDWDQRNGRQLFQWDDPLAAAAHRLHQARLFLNSFRLMLPTMRVRSFTNLPEDGVKGSERAYFSVETITARPELRAAVVADLTARMTTLAMELRFWKLTDKERAKVIAQLDEAMKAE